MVEQDFQRLRIRDPMAVEAFLNPAQEVDVTGELTDEEIIGMVNHAEAEAEGTGRGTYQQGEGSSSTAHEPDSEGTALLSTAEALNSIQSLIHKLLIDTNVPDAGLKAIGTLRELEKAWRIQKLRESTVQQSILSYFPPMEN